MNDSFVILMESMCILYVYIYIYHILVYDVILYDMILHDMMLYNILPTYIYIYVVSIFGGDRFVSVRHELPDFNTLALAPSQEAMISYGHPMAPHLTSHVRTLKKGPHSV